MTAHRPLIACVLAAALAACGGDDGREGLTLYVLNSASNDTAVIDVATNEVVGFLTTGPRPHGIAAPADHGLLYVANEGGKKGLVVVDPASGEIVGRHAGFGDRPGEIEITSEGRYVYVPAKGDGVYRVFDTVEERIVATIPTDGQPHNVVVSPDDRFMYLACMDGGNLPVEKLIKAGLPTTENEKIYVVDTERHEVVATIDCGGTPRTIAISPDGRRLYVNLDGLVGFVVLDLEERRLLHRIEHELTDAEREVPSRSHGILVTPDGRELWSVDVNHRTIFVHDLSSEPPPQVARMPTGKLPLWLACTPDGATMYLSNAGDDTISVYDVARREEVARIALPEGKVPKRLLVLDVQSR